MDVNIAPGVLEILYSRCWQGQHSSGGSIVPQTNYSWRQIRTPEAKIKAIQRNQTIQMLQLCWLDLLQRLPIGKGHFDWLWANLLVELNLLPIHKSLVNSWDGHKLWKKSTWGAPFFHPALQSGSWHVFCARSFWHLRGRSCNKAAFCDKLVVKFDQQKFAATSFGCSCQLKGNLHSLQIEPSKHVQKLKKKEDSPKRVMTLFFRERHSPLQGLLKLHLSNCPPWSKENTSAPQHPKSNLELRS